MNEHDIVQRLEELDLAVEELKTISTRGSGEDLPVRLKQKQIQLEAEQEELRGALKQASGRS